MNAARTPHSRLVSLTVLLRVALLLALPVGLWADGSEVVLLFNSKWPDSESVARYYAEKRGVPTNQILGFGFDSPGQIQRKDYMKFVEDFLIRELDRRELAKFHADLVPATKDRPGRIKYRLTSAKFRYLVPTFGVPWQIPDAGDWSDETPVNGPVPTRRNGACLDSELALLPMHGSLPYSGPLRNPRFGVTNAALLHPTNGVVIVSRLDGPTPELAKGLVDKALTAEREGLWGRAYFDLRNITSGGYALGDQWITNAATASRDVGFETVVDNLPAEFNNAFPMSQIALYFGWYASNAMGPFGLSSVEFAPGAIGYHLHSYSASQLRSPTLTWVGPLVAKGVTFTMGCTDEPYLAFTPQVNVFLESLMKLGFTAGEAALNCQGVLSWQIVSVGDPLYRPGAKNPIEWAQELEARNSPLRDWAELRKVNMHLRQNRDTNTLRDYLIQLPFSRTSAVISEKVADIFAEQGKLDEAIEWEQRAIKAGGTPQQRVRLFRTLAGWQRTQKQFAEALESLTQFTGEFPGHPDMLNVRREQLRLARQLKRDEQATFFKQEVDRLDAPAATNAPAGGEGKK